MKSSDVKEARPAGATQADWSGIGWNDSSWELAHGLEVQEVPLDDWPFDLPAPKARAPRAEPVTS